MNSSKLWGDHLTLKDVSDSHETWATLGHLLRTRYPIRKKHRYHRCVSPCVVTSHAGDVIARYSACADVP